MSADELPKPGDRVRLGYDAREYVVKQRYRVTATGQVNLVLDDDLHYAVEHIHWAPSPGDQVGLIHKITLQWYDAMAEYAKFGIAFGDRQWKAKQDQLREWQIEASTPGSWFYTPHTLDEIVDNFAVIGEREYPIQCVTVVRKNQNATNITAKT